jgi:Peptidase family C25
VNIRGARSTLAALALLAGSAAEAQSTWTGLGLDGLWTNPANWNPSTQVPPPGSNVTFGGSASIVDTSFSIGRLATSGIVTISASGGSTLTINTGITQSGGTAELDISAPIAITNAAELWTITGPSNTFSGAISGSSFLKTGSGTLTLSGNNTFGSLNVTVGTLVLSGSNIFSSANVTAGTLQATTSAALGAAAITMTGGTLSLSNSSAITSSASVGVFGNSTLAVQGGGQHSVDTLDISSGTTLTVTNLNGSSLSVPGTSTGIGLTGSGTLNGAVSIPAGGNLTPGDSDGTGTLTVTTLGLTSTSNLNYAVGTSAPSVTVGTALTVTGVVNITDNGLTQGGPYVLIQGSPSAPLTAGALTLGTVPSGFSYGLAVTNNQLLLTVGPAPTAVEMAARDAISDGHASYITWKTGVETRTLGYHVYRQDGSVRTLLTPGLIAGSALRATADLKVGRSYVWIDRTSPAGGTYWVDSIDMNGKTVTFGPMTTHTGPTPNGGSSPLLSDAIRSSSLAGQTQPLVHLRGADSPPVPGDLAQQWLNAAGSAAKVLVRDSGVYRVPAEQLFTSGIPVGADVSAVQLWTSGVPVSFRAITADGAHLQPGDAIEFYGRGIDTRYSGTRLYWVTAGLGGQQLMTTQAPVPSVDAGKSFAETLEIRQRLYYFSGVKNGGAEKFFGPQVSSTGLTRVFPTPALDVFSSTSGALTVAVQGLTAGPHSISVVLNGVLLGTLTGVNTNLMSKTFVVPVSQLHAGDNTVVLVAQSTTDIDVESYQQLSYPRQYLGLGTPLQFTAPGGSSVRLQNFGVKTTRVFDITNPEASVELSVSVDPANQSGSVVNVPSSSETHTLYAFQAGDEIPLLDVQSNVASQWHSFAGAQLVIIGHATLLATVQPLVEQRQREGLTVAAVDVQDVYDEFSFGEKDAGAIRAFLQYAAQKWTIAPRYVLLVGGATYDPRDYLNNPGLDLVPTNLIETVFLETGSDGAFVDFAAPKSPGIAIGRWPVTSPSDAALVMNKTLGRVPLTSKSTLLLVHDTDTTTKFSAASAQVRSAVSPWLVQEIARGTGTDAAIHTAVIAAIRSGPAALDYQGHGAEDFWNGNLLSDEDASVLANSGQSLLFSAATCFNGYFVDIGRTSLAQAMLLTEGGGAWAAWASSGMTSPVEHSQLSSDLLEAAVVDGLTLGDASVRAKSTITDPDVRNTFHLFGDPSARMAPPVAGALTGPDASGIHTHVASGCGTPGTLALAVLPWVVLALLLSARARRPMTVRTRRR